MKTISRLVPAGFLMLNCYLVGIGVQMVVDGKIPSGVFTILANISFGIMQFTAAYDNFRSN